jgi:hypothetical protein
MSKPIDLGKKFNDDIGGPISIKELTDEVHYPDFYISDTDELGLLDMPDEGEATIKYKIVNKTQREDSRNGKKRRRCSITIEVRSIEPPAASKNGKKKNHWEMFNS